MAMSPQLGRRHDAAALITHRKGGRMQFGMIGLGRMGASMVRRLLKRGHAWVVHDVQPAAVSALAKYGATGAVSPKELVSQLGPPRTIWLIVPAVVVDRVLDDLVPLLDAGGIIIDGGNSHYRDDMRRGVQLQARGIHCLDVGTSAPGAGTAEEGFLHCGPLGAGHFVKMVHNGIEYGVMAAYAQGLNILRSANLGQRERQAQSEHDAETTPLRDPESYRFEMNLPEICEVWRRGSVIGSWLLDLTATALQKDPGLADYGGRVSDSGEGRWTIQAAIDEGVPVPVLSAALFERFTSRGNADFANRVLSAMRYEFGGHAEKPAS